MTRLYGNVAGAAEVRRRDDEPEQFLWRDRLYLVRSVLGHWMESGDWWRVRSAGEGTIDEGVLDDHEREFWRVEAKVGRLGETGVFELCFDWSRGGWTVTRVQD